MVVRMLKQIINNSPSAINKTIRYAYYSIPDYIRYGRVFRETYKFLEESQYWDKSQLEEYQINQLQKIIRHAYETVYYYKKIFDEYDIKPNQIQDFGDLKKVPYLTKEIIRSNLSDLISNKYNKKNLGYVTTGGSTGMPMRFYVDNNYDRPREWAFIAHMWSRIGYNTKKLNKSVILRGLTIDDGYYEYKNRALILSSFSLKEQNIISYLNLIKKFNPTFIQAYPSSISIMSKYIIENKIEMNLKDLKAIICASENLYEYQRNEIEQAFESRVYSFYGHSEHACIGGECEKSHFYHLQSEYGYTELINENEQDVTEEDEIGEIVATGFNNYVIPFIRYRTCDMVINTDKGCSCGRNYKLIKGVEGRKQYYFIDKCGNKITFIWADNALWRVNNKVFAYQYIQNKPGKVILNIELKKDFSSEDYEYIKQDFGRFYRDFDMKITIVKHIERTRQGKFKYLIQNINKEF